MSSHKHYLQQALDLAATRRGFCAPNPAVGAVIVKNNQVIGQGAHYGPGYPHAEINALAEAQHAAKGATLYVTLEPCCHTGRTPPCVNAIIEANIKKVIFGFQDPNPLVAGKGKQRLQEANIACDQLALPEINAFYQSYAYWTQTRKPWVTVKIALSKNNKIAHKQGKTASITGDEAQRFTHLKRKHADALLTSINTVLADDPRLNVRTASDTVAKPVYLLDSHCRLPKTAALHQSASTLTLFHATETPCSIAIRQIALSTTDQGLDLNKVIAHIGADGIQDLWVEAGGKTFSALVNAKLADEIYVYQSPKLLEQDALALPLTLEEISMNYRTLDTIPLGEDLAFHFINNHSLKSTRPP